MSGFIDAAIARFDFFEFVILNARVWLRHDDSDDLAVGRMYISELRREAGSEEWTTSYGVYHDRFAAIDDRWWFAQRRYHSLARTPPDGGAFPFPVRQPVLSRPRLPGVPTPGPDHRGGRRAGIAVRASAARAPWTRARATART